MPLVALVVETSPDREQALIGRLRSAGHAVVRSTTAADIACNPDVVLVPGDLATSERDAIQARVGAAPVWTITDGVIRQLAQIERSDRTMLVLSACQVDLRMRTVFRDGAATGLTEKEAALLSWLVARPNQAVSREQLLEHVWGYRREMQTRTVDATVLRLRAKIESVPAKPTHVLTVRGEGYRFVPHESAPVATPAQQPPQPARSIIGRSAELRELDELAQGGPGVVTVLGAPGIGKTTLVRSWCRGPFVELASTRTESDIVAAVSDALDVEPAGIASALGRFIAFDNAEQVAEPLAELLSSWLAKADQTTVVLTSRLRLGIAAERVLEVGPLENDAAIELLLTRARERRPRFAETERDRAHIAALVVTLERVPLALELAAARARLLSPRDLADRLRRDLSPLRDTSRPGRHASVEGACLWSWNLLQPAEKGALTALSVFRGGFSAAGAEALGVDLDVLEQLIDHSLVYVAGSGGGQVRFDLLETIRGFAEGRLEDDTARDLHAQWMADWGALAEPRARQSYAGLADIGRERANLTAAVRHLLERSAELAAQVLLAARPRWFMHHTPPDHLELLTVLWDRLEDGALKAGLGYHYSAALTRYGHVERSLPIAEQAVAIAREAGDPEALAEALMGLDFALQISGRADEASALLQQIPSNLRPHLKIASLVSASTLHRRFGNANRTEAFLREALGLAEAHGMEPYKVALQGHLGGALFIASREAESIALSEAALDVHRANQNTREIVQIGTNLAAAYTTSGDPKRGLRAMEEVVELAVARGRPMETARAQMHLSRAQLATGNPTAALATAQESVLVSEALGSAGDCIFGHVDIANALLDLGRPDDALREAQLSLDRAVPMAVPRLVAMGLICVARCHQDRGELEQAAEAFVQAIEQDSDDTPIDTVYLNAALSLVQVRAGHDGQMAASQAQELAESRRRTDRSRGVAAPLAQAMARFAAGKSTDSREAFERALDATKRMPDGRWSASVQVYALVFDPDAEALERAFTTANARVRHAAAVVRSLHQRTA